MHGNGTKGGYSSNGLVLLYEAAMLIEQQSPRPQRLAPAAVSHSAVVSRKKPLPSDSIVNGGLQHLVRASPGNGFRVPTGTAIRVPIGPAGRVRLEPVAAAAEESPSLPSASAGAAANRAAGQHRRTVQSVSSRSSHNELEKNRRAHLRQCLDSLRDQLPMCPGQANRLTMLNVLNRSHGYLKELQSLSSEQGTKLSAAQRRQKELLLRREQMRRTLRTLRRQLSAAKSAKKAAAAATAAAAAAATKSASDAWRCRNVSEISAASASSEEMELSAMDSSNSSAGAGGSSVPGSRAVVCDSPDSGYATPPSCAAAGPAAAGTTIMA